MIKGRRVVCDGRVRCGVVWEIFSDRESPSEQASVGAWWLIGWKCLEMIKGRRVVCGGRVRRGVVWEIFSDRESPSEQASVGAWWMDGLRELIN